jgi:hypothetical protein
MLSAAFNLSSFAVFVYQLNEVSVNYILFKNSEWRNGFCGKELEGKLNLACSFKVREIPGHANAR